MLQIITIAAVQDGNLLSFIGAETYRLYASLLILLLHDGNCIIKRDGGSQLLLYAIVLLPALQIPAISSADKLDILPFILAKNRRGLLLACSGNDGNGLIKRQISILRARNTVVFTIPLQILAITSVIHADRLIFIKTKLPVLLLLSGGRTQLPYFIFCELADVFLRQSDVLITPFEVRPPLALSDWLSLW